MKTPPAASAIFSKSCLPNSADADFASPMTPLTAMGFGLPGENAHAPNEWMSDENFVKGAKAVAAFWDELAPR